MPARVGVDALALQRRPGKRIRVEELDDVGIEVEPAVDLRDGDHHRVAGYQRSDREDRDGAVVAWGDNQWGQINVQALPPGVTYVEVAEGIYHTAARRSDGSVVAWGHNAYGQSNVPVLTSGLAYVEIAASE